MSATVVNFLLQGPGQIEGDTVTKNKNERKRPGDLRKTNTVIAAQPDGKKFCRESRSHANPHCHFATSARFPLENAGKMFLALKTRRLCKRDQTGFFRRKY